MLKIPKPCLNQTSFSLLFHFGNSEFLNRTCFLVTKLLYKVHKTDFFLSCFNSPPKHRCHFLIILQLKNKNYVIFKRPEWKFVKTSTVLLRSAFLTKNTWSPFVSQSVFSPVDVHSWGWNIMFRYMLWNLTLQHEYHWV